MWKTEQDEPQTILLEISMSRKEQERDNPDVSSPPQDVHNKGHTEGTPGREKRDSFLSPWHTLSRCVIRDVVWESYRLLVPPFY